MRRQHKGRRRVVRLGFHDSERAIRCLLILALAGLAWFPASAGDRASSTCTFAAPDAAHAGNGCARAWFDANLRINDIQTVGTAESYKLPLSPGMLSLIAGQSHKDADALDFGEPLLDQQLDAGARSLEFDIAYDPKGGLFANPAGAAMADEMLDPAYVTAMSRPGFKVIHVPDVDYHSTCPVLTACLRQIAAWSQRYPDHVPIVIALKTDDERTPMPGATEPLAFDAAAFDALDAEILSIFHRHNIITPDDVQDGYPTLRAAVLAGHWPLLGASRGKVIFLLNDSPAKVALYRGQRKSLEGRVLFIATDEKSPAAAFINIRHPVRAAARITADVKTGFMVRTRADADTREARRNQTQRRDWALASGAQIVATDFITADPKIGGYAVHLPGGHGAVCDAVLLAQRCGGWSLEPDSDPASITARMK